MSDEFAPETETKIDRGGSGGIRKTAVGAKSENSPSDNGLNTVICDRSLLIRFGFSVMLEPIAKIVGDAGDGLAAVELTRRLLPDLLIFDIDLDGMNGLEVCKVLSKENPALRFLALTDSFFATRYYHQLCRAGVTGICMKSGGPQTLFEAIRRVEHSMVYCDPLIAEMVKPTARPVKCPGAPLTDRETNVLVRLALRNQEIGEELSLGLIGVETALESAMQKLNAPTRAAAALKAMQLGFTPLPKMPERGESGVSEEQLLAEQHAIEAIETWRNLRQAH